MPWSRWPASSATLRPTTNNSFLGVKHIVLFGGSFDPIHIGHAIVASYVAQFCDVDEVWLMPGRINPLKLDRRPAPANARLEMCRLVAGKIPGVTTCDLEMHLPEPSYTIDTLSELKRLYPHFRFSLLIGSDNWEVFHLWRKHEEILANHGVIIYPRPGHDIDADTFPDGVTLLGGETPHTVMSSTFVRNAIAEGRDMNFFLPEEVMKYIEINNLYRK